MKIGKVIQSEITQEMKKSYLDYAMSVIVSRALPDVRDGLKPVHRRILYAMHEMGMTPASSYTKSAKVVGETMGKYHPHGDNPIYESLVRMAQDFSMRYTLVDGQGNFGSVDGDPPAAMRYCVTGNTLIVTERGLEKAKDISHEEKINIRVLSINQETNRASKWFVCGKHPTIKIETKQGLTLQGTYNHPVLVLEKDVLSGKPKFQWKLLEELKIGDFAVIDRTATLLWPKKKLNLETYLPQNLHYRAKSRKLPKTLDKNLALILGLLVSEGYVGEKRLGFINSDTEIVSRFIFSWAKVFPDSPLHEFKRKPTSYGKKPWWDIEMHCRYTVDFLKKLGLKPVKSPVKSIPEVIFKSPKEIAACFLQGYFEGDGSISSAPKMVELSAVSKSKKLIEGLQILLLRFGIASTRRYDKYRETHKLYIRGYKNYKLFQKYIGFISKKKKDKLENIIANLKKDQSYLDYIPYLKEYIYSNVNNFLKYEKRAFLFKHNFDRYSNLSTWQEEVSSTVAPTVTLEVQKLIRNLLANNYLFDPIISIEDGGKRNVYSLKVESGCHSFVGNGFINHNTEVRPDKISQELLRDIDKNTVEYEANFDSTLKEPKFLPGLLPNLLLMGAEGIAVGMATKIPPHNLSEVVDAIIEVLKAGRVVSPEEEEKDNDFFIKKIELAVSQGKEKETQITAPKVDFASDVTLDTIMSFIKGPDFPTGGIIYGGKFLPELYSTGKGKITVRGIAKIEEGAKGKMRIVITELPYQVNKAMLVKKIAELARDKKINGIADLRDESDKRGMSVVIDLKRDGRPKAVLNNLYKHTDLQTSFPANFVALVDGIPRTLSLKQILIEYVRHRQKVVTKRSIFDLTEAKRRAHILEGLKIALDNLDAVIQTIRKSKDTDTAKNNLISKFGFSEIQAVAILDMQLRRLSALEREKIENEYKEVGTIIEYLTDILTHPEKILEVIKDELSALKEKYKDLRRTKVVASPIGEMSEEDLVAKEDSIITITKTGYIKRVPRTTYKSQRRGGKGVVGMTTKEEDEIAHIVSATTHDTMLFFTNKGRVFKTRVWEIQETARQSKGQAVVNLINTEQGETVEAILPLEQQEGAKYLVMATKNGVIKRTALSEFKNLRSSGLIAIRLNPGDALSWVRPTDGESHILMVTKKGKSIRFSEKDARPLGRPARGVRGIKITDGDQLVGMEVFPAKPQTIEDKRKKVFRDILVITYKGIGKRTPIQYFPIQKRGGIGVKIANLTEKTGDVAAAIMVWQEFDQIIITSSSGQVIRLPLKNIPQLGRATQGVILMRFSKRHDHVAGIATLEKQQENPIQSN